VSSPTAPRRRALWDIVLSIVLLVVAIVGAAIGGFLQLFLVAFTDYCPPKTCHQDLGLSEVGIVYVCMVVVLLAAIVLTILLLVLRRRAWWIALIGLIVVAIGVILAIALYFFAVGGT
jgi:uncharacterized BrkB/YihY/UPF0761 family membrane protein